VQGDPIGPNGGLNIFAYAYGNPLSYRDVNGNSPGGWAPTGAPPVGDVNTIYCLNGRLELYILPINGGDKCPAIEKCLRVHEDTHRKDAIAFDGNICKGRNNIAIGYYGEDGRNHRESNFSKTAELKALDNQIACLKASLRDEDCDSYCRNWIEKDMAQRENEKIKVMNGTYP
jgi:hypothetical protein